MKRKVNLVGQNTLTVSLPAKWAKDNGLSRGDEVELSEKDGFLMLSCDAKRANFSRMLSIKISSEKEYSSRFLTIPYVRGYEHIKIYYDNLSILERIEDTLKLTPGFEIIVQEKNCVDIKMIFDMQSQDFDVIFERLYNVIIVGLDEIISELNTGNFSNARFLNKLSLESDKYELFCRRILNTNGYKNSFKRYSVYTMLKYYELLGDMFKVIYDFLDKNGKSMIDKHLQLSKYTEHILELIKFNHKIFYSKNDNSFVSKVRDSVNSLKSEYSSILKGKQSSSGMVISGYLFQINQLAVHLAEESLYSNSES